MRIDIPAAARLLLEARDALLIAHKSPDGDTLGSCFALYHALTGLGIRARVVCSDEIPARYGFCFPEGEMPRFDPRFIAAVDVADTKLLGKGTEIYADRVDLCIDHHQTNKDYARRLCLDHTQAATAQIVYRILGAMGCAITPKIADCLYMGVTTDTGGFRHANVTAETHRIAADLIARGAQAYAINRAMFGQKTRRRIEVERMVMDSLRYSFGGRCAEICLSREILDATGATEDELAGVSDMPRQIEGVWAGVTYSERDGGFKISMRTDSQVDASKVCEQFGGGGHKRAAGCFIEGSFDEAQSKMHGVLGRYLS